MSFTLLGDEFSDDADMAQLSDAAFRTHAEALIWSSSRLLDLQVPKRDLSRFAFSEHRDQAVAELCGAGWWVDNGDCWFIAHRDYWQWTKAQHEARKLSNRRATKHRRGDHSLCLPGKCSGLSAADTAADTHADVSAVVSDVLGEAKAREGFRKQPTTKVSAAARCVTCLVEAPVDASGECQTCTKAWAS